MGSPRSKFESFDPEALDGQDIDSGGIKGGAR